MGIGAVVPVALALPLCLLTVLGGHRRGAGLPAAVLGGVVFPITWAIWYVRDEQPYRQSAHPVRSP
jgi:hypothetical protein